MAFIDRCRYNAQQAEAKRRIGKGRHAQPHKSNCPGLPEICPLAQEFANFLKKRAAIEEDNANGLKRLARTTSDNMRRSDHLGGSFAKAFDGMMGTHSRIAENGIQYAMSLLQMAEDLNELAAIAEKQRKGWKQDGLAAEHRAADVEAQMRKSQAKYHSLADEYDRVRTGDGQKGGKMFGFKGPKSAAQHEEELLRKVQASDQDYKNKVQAYQQERGQLISTTRPDAIKALQDIVKECDSGLVLQMQKFGEQRPRVALWIWLTSVLSILQREASTEQWLERKPSEKWQVLKTGFHELKRNCPQRRYPAGFERVFMCKPQQGPAEQRGTYVRAASCKSPSTLRSAPCNTN